MVLKEKKIFLTGGSGTLGTELQKLNPKIIAPSSKECNILSLEQLRKAISTTFPDVFVHAAAFTNVTKAQENSSECIDTNVQGTINVIKACREKNLKLIFISTNYVFDGEKGNYKVTDPINPLSYYSKTKGAAELIAQTYPNHLIIRTSFFKYDFPYDKAAVDQWTSKDYIDIIAPKVLEKIESDESGIVHVGSPRRSIYEIAKQRKKTVQAISLDDLNFPIPKDTSFYE